MQLITLRSNDQFNTTVYSYHDHFRSVKGTRMVVFMHPLDIERAGFEADELVDMQCAVEDGVRRVVHQLQVVPFSIPEGCVGA
jgi:anaerobic selenocysteine-containing dehydrogenase